MAEKPSLSIITCHPDSPDVSALRNSIEANLGWQDTELVPVVGAESIAKAYNQGARTAQGVVLLFTHADVELLASRAMMGAAVRALMNGPRSGVLGIAGSTLLNHDCIWWQSRDHTSGCCLHDDPEKVWPTAFGPYGRVVVLDGVLLMVRRDVYDAVGGFDEEIVGWDYYDVDFSLRAHLAGYQNSTFPLHVLHHSVGAGCIPKYPGEVTQWEKNRRAFIERWKSVLPVSL